MGKEDYQAVLLDPPDLYKFMVDAGKKMTVGDRVVVLYALLDSATESQASQDVVRRLRSDRAVLDGTLSVGGQSASDMDATAFVREKTPRAIGFVMAMTFVILFLLLGSIVLPIKAIVMNFVSVSRLLRRATVWVFQEGPPPRHRGAATHRARLAGAPLLRPVPRAVDGLPGGVLMLSRIKESYEKTALTTRTRWPRVSRRPRGLYQAERGSPS